MDECYKFTTLFLLYLMAVIDCQSSLTISGGEGSITHNVTNLDLDLSMKFTSDEMSFIGGTTYSSCTFKFWPVDNNRSIYKIALRCTANDVSCPILCSAPKILSEWSNWTDCEMSNGMGMMYRFKNVTCANDGRTCCLPINISLVDKQECRPYTGQWSAWSNWSECSSSGEQYRNRSLIWSQNQPQCLLPSNDSPFERKNCTFNPGNWSAWSDWSECLSSGEQHRHRSFICSQNQPQCLLPSNSSSLETKNCTSNLGNWSAWSNWSECLSSGIQFRHRSLICSQNQPQCLLPSNKSSLERNNCTTNLGNWSAWSNWSECSSSGEQYRHRSLICSKNQPQCLLPSNDSPFERKNCTFNPDASAQGNRKENIKEDEKRYTLSEIILVAFGCLLMGVILTALLFTLYMKRTQQGCFSNIIMEPQGDSRQQCGPDLQFQTKKAVVKKYDPKMPESADSKYENKSEETQYQSLNSNQIDNDQQTYDKLELKEPISDHHGIEPRSGRLKQTGNDERTDHMTNKTERINDNIRDSNLGGHNYFILENENISRESKTSNLGRPNSYAVVGDGVRDSNLGTLDEESDAAHEYFVLEPVENRHNQD